MTYVRGVGFCANFCASCKCQRLGFRAVVVLGGNLHIVPCPRHHVDRRVLRLPVRDQQLPESLERLGVVRTPALFMIRDARRYMLFVLVPSLEPREHLCLLSSRHGAARRAVALPWIHLSRSHTIGL